MKKIIILCLILFLNKGLIASVNNNPFEYFLLSIELMENVNNNDLHYFYQPNTGFKTSFSSFLLLMHKIKPLLDNSLP